MNTRFPNMSLLKPQYFAIWAMAVAVPFVRAQTNKDQVVDLSQVPQLHETAEQRDARRQWFRDVVHE